MRWRPKGLSPGWTQGSRECIRAADAAVLAQGIRIVVGMAAGLPRRCRVLEAVGVGLTGVRERPGKRPAPDQLGSFAPCVRCIAYPWYPR